MLKTRLLLLTILALFVSACTGLQPVVAPDSASQGEMEATSALLELDATLPLMQTCAPAFSTMA